jgi:hypothetical protein
MIPLRSGFAVLASGLVLAALAGLLIPSARRLQSAAGKPAPATALTVAGESAPAAEAGGKRPE